MTLRRIMCRLLRGDERLILLWSALDLPAGRLERATYALGRFAAGQDGPYR